MKINDMFDILIYDVILFSKKKKLNNYFIRFEAFVSEIFKSINFCWEKINITRKV